MRTLIALVAILLAVAPSAHANPFAAPFEAPAGVPPGFTETVQWSGLGNPTVVRFADDGRVFVASKSGIINVFDDLEDTTPTRYADLRERVHDYWDRGLLGLALDPDFTGERPYVYVLYAYDKAPDSTRVPRWGDTCPTPPGPTGDGCTVTGRLSRLAPDSSETVLIEDFCQQYPSHSVGSLEFGPDGMLYVSAGDGASFDWADYGQDGSPVNPCDDPPHGPLTRPSAQGGALRSQAFRRPAGQEMSYSGSILRVDPATGHAAPGNAPNADPRRERVIAYGLRNPFRFALRPGTNEVWAGDVGWNQAEEINRVPEDRSRVPNFGWPCYEGRFPMGAYDTLDLTSCETLYAEGAADPYFHYFHWDKVVPGEACPSGTSSISGLTFYTGATFPAAYRDALFFSDYSRRCIWVVFKGADGLPDFSTRQTFVAGAHGPAWLSVGPDGALYYADILGGAIRRIAADNHAPVARIDADPVRGVAPLEVRFDGTASSDPEGSALTYAWDLDGDGVFDDSTDARPTYTYTSAGLVTARLRVTDADDAQGTASVTISVGAPPEVSIAAPLPSRTWEVGETIAFSGSARDAADAPLELTWALELRHCWRGDPENCHTHPVQNFTGDAGSFAAPDHEYPSHLVLTATAVDANGLRTTEHVRLNPRTAEITMASDPPGFELSLGSDTLRAPFTHTVLARSRNSIGAPSPQPLRDGLFTWARWTGGLEIVDSVDAPASGAVTYTATFAQPPRTGLAGAEHVGAATASAQPGFGSIYRMTAGRDGTAHSLRLYLDETSRASGLVLGLYEEVAGHPAALLGSAAVAAPAPGAWNSAWLEAGVPIVAGGAYWLAILNPAGASGTLVWRDRAGEGELAQTTPAIGSLPGTWTSADGHWHVDGHVSGGAWPDKRPPGPTPNPTPTPTAAPPVTAAPTPTPTPTAAPTPATPPSVLPAASPTPEPPSPPRLVGAWGFDERGGVTAADASGSGNAGVLNGPARVKRGRFGRALRFDGRNDWVTVPRSPSLDRTTGLTVEAWVRPSRRGGWRTLAVKETARGLAWGLYPFGSRGRLTGSATSASERWATGPRLRLRRWTHVAVTFDGAAIRTYLNGRLAGTRAQPGPLPISRHPLRFGGNAVWREWFAGLIDEVRVYDGALTAEQIEADMRRPIGGPVRGDRRKPGKGAKIRRYRGRAPHGR